MDIYKLSRNFWDYAFANPEKIKPNHVAVYSFAIEHCNRLGWKQKFGFPTSMVLEAIGLKSYSVYKKTFDDLVSYGFFEVIEYSKNQYSSNIIALKENCKAHSKAHSKALDKALTKHGSKQGQSTGQSTVSIDIQSYNSTNLQDGTIQQPQLDLQNSNLFRKPKVPPLDEVKMFFRNNGGTDEMAQKFYDKWDGVGWYYNNSPIVNYSSFANNFIANFKKFENGHSNNQGGNGANTSSKPSRIDAARKF